MSQEIMSILTFIASVAGSYLTYRASVWISKRKVPAEVRQLDADTDLKSGDLVEKYRGIAERTADDNIDLAKQLRVKEDEKNQLTQSLKQLRSDVEEQNKIHNQEIEALRQSFEEERIENERWRNWARRLVLQIQSLGFIEVPFDVEEARRLGYSMGDMGSYKPDQPSNKK